MSRGGSDNQCSYYGWKTFWFTCLVKIQILQEVAARFIPRFYYEGPFTPVAEEEKEEAKHQTEIAASAASAAASAAAAAAAARRRTSPEAEGNRREDRSAPVPARGLRKKNSGPFGVPSSSLSSGRPPPTPSPAKKKANFLETSATLLAARRWARAGSGCAAPAFTLSASAVLDDGRPSTTTAAEMRPAGEVRKDHQSRRSFRAKLVGGRLGFSG